jgi:isocitrate dehydrogenase
MKLTEGEVKRTFERIAPEYPDIKSWHVIIDNCAHQLVKKPGQFDVIVTTNMNGDIISDLTSALVGGLGFAPSANLGNGIAIFEAVHGSAPKYAGKDVINPTAVILSSVMMLKYLGEFEAAAAIEHAVLTTLLDGKLTGDVVGYDKGVKTSEYTKAVIKNLGRKADGWKVRTAKPIKMPELSRNQVFRPAKTKEVVGADIFVESAVVPAELGPSLEAIAAQAPLKLKMISNRGTKVYPDGNPNIDCVSQHRCRFMTRSGSPIAFDDALALARKINETHEVCHIERLLRIDGADGFTKAQGED